MKYKIVQLVMSTRYVPDGYDMASQTIYGWESLIGMPWAFEDTHNTIEAAVAEIEKFKDNLTYCTITIIPFLKIEG